MKNKIFPTSFLIEKNANFLNNLLTCSRSKNAVNKIISNASDEQLLCLVEICLNLLKGRLPFHKNRIQNLQNQASLLRKISRSRSASSAKRLLLCDKIQNGRGFPPVAGLLASLIVPLIAENFVK